VIEVPVVPAPLRAERRAGHPFMLRPGVRIQVAKDATAVATAVLLATQIAREVDGQVAVAHEDSQAPGAIALRLTTVPAGLPITDHLPIALAAEAYRLEVDHQRVVITALEPSGLARGVQTLTQLITRDPENGGAVIEPVLVVDHPRFAWRGLMLDLARHFFDLETIRTVIAVMASLKLNVLHLHLTDDQGWRLDIPSRPELATVGGATSVGRDPGGWLSAREYSELVVFAAAHAVTIVPEFDLPGHVGAALRTYGALCPDGRRMPAHTGAKAGFSRLHADLPATVPFIRDVLTDMARMTRGSYLHIGGDEVLTMEPDEYRELVTVAVNAVGEAGKKVVGWQEIASVPLPAGSVVQYWDEREGPGGVLAAADRGAQVLLSPASRVYLDMKYDDATPVGSEWAGHIELETAYSWDPGDLIGLQDRQIAGVEAALWTETIRTPRELFVLMLPRLAATAEVAWSAPDRKEHDDFLARLDRTTPRWDAAGWPWHRAAVQPGSHMVAG
jgi:hexosaminidase